MIRFLCLDSGKFESWSSVNDILGLIHELAFNDNGAHDYALFAVVTAMKDRMRKTANSP